MKVCLPSIVSFYMDGKIDIDPIITHTLKLEDINKGFDLMQSAGNGVLTSWPSNAASQ
jgi:Zn-dependent alcohol dehydrogenase